MVPTGNFGDVLAGYFAKRMGLPIEKLVIATNENDILDRFWKSGTYEKHPVHGKAAEGGLVTDGVKAHEEGVKETLSPAMDILVSSNFERLLWFLSYADAPSSAGSEEDKRKYAGEQVRGWLMALKNEGGFAVSKTIFEAAKVDFESERVSDTETVETIKAFYTGDGKGYILDPHSAIGVAASLRSIQRARPPWTHHVSLATAHPAKFASAVQLALGGREEGGLGGLGGKEEGAGGSGGFDFEKEVLPPEFVGLETRARRVRVVPRGGGVQGMRRILDEGVGAEGVGCGMRGSGDETGEGKGEKGRRGPQNT